MTSFRVILPLACGVFVYCAFSIVLGPRGLWSSSQLSSERDKLLENLESLYAINADLDARVRNLAADPDTIAMYAHEIGFVFEGERLIRLAGFSGGIDRRLSAGFPIKAESPAFLPEWICKIFGISGGLACFFLQLITERQRLVPAASWKKRQDEDDALPEGGQSEAQPEKESGMAMEGNYDWLAQ